MDWMQVLTIVSTIVASIYALHSFLRSDIKEFKQEIKEDMLAHEERFERRMEIIEADRRYNDERVRHIDEKWERLFERFAAQDTMLEKLTARLSGIESMMRGKEHA
jgi:predicted nuclease with TOPRIM domain